jgi:two-component system cell cycle sensor histidine kinase/response regulator CckA
MDARQRDEIGRMEGLLRLQRDLSLALATTNSLSEALAHVLDATLRIDGMDCGGIYIVHEVSGDVDLVAHKGVSRRFVEEVSHFGPDSPQARLVMAGRPVYLATGELPQGHPACASEGIRALAILPVPYEGRVITVLNVASRRHGSIPGDSRDALEAVTAQIGSAIDRIRAREALQRARNELERRVEERTAELRIANERLQREVADRIAVEEALRASEERYRLLAEAAKDCIYIIDRDDRVRYVNAFAASQFRARPEQIAGMRRSDLFPPALAARQKRNLDKVFETGEPLAEESVLSLPGKETWQHTQLVPLRDGDGTVTGVLGISRDISDIKRAADALRESEERHRIILDQMQEAVIFADADHVIRDINACACALLQTTRGEVLGRDVVSVHAAPVQPRIAAVLGAFRNGGRQPVVTVRRSLGDREVIFRVSPAHGSDGAYRGVIVAIGDITEQMRMQGQLAEAQKLETVGRLAGGIAHDFNNLMQTALGSASCLRSKYPPGHPNHAILLRVETAADTAGKLAHQLLVYAKGGKIAPRVVDFADVVSRAVEIFGPSVPSGVLLGCGIADDLGRVECDTTRTEQAIVNLCRNAVDAMPQGGRLTVRANNVTLAGPLEDSHPPLPAGDYVCVAVEDTGSGVAREILGQLFDPFFTTKPDGHGLGLAATYGTVKAHGGAISVKTSLGHGSTFQIWLPRVHAEKED